MTTATEKAYYSILDTYTPLDVKDILLHGASRKATHHKSQDDILSWYADHMKAYIIHYLTQALSVAATT